MKQPLVVVSGLPASGKSTLGRLLAKELGLPLIDKDTILEALFDSLGCPDRTERERLSRASDEVLLTSAAAAGRAVLVNWWNPETAPPRLRAISSYVVEVFCDCPVEVAVARFEERRRHPGHHDPQRSPAEVEEQVRRVGETYAGALKLGGPLVRVDTSAPLTGNDVVARVREALDLGAG